MIGINLLLRLAKLSFPIVGVLFFLKLVPIRIANSLVLAQNSSGRKLGSHLVSQQQQTEAPDPPETPSQDSKSGGGDPPMRPGSVCPNIKPPLTALKPAQTTQNKILISQEKPKFWFYVPYKPDLIKRIELEWEEIDNEEFESEKIPLPKPKMSGIIGVSVPPEAPSLENGKQYVLTLTLKVRCSSGAAQPKTDLESLKVQTHKLTPSQKNQLNKATTAVQKINFYSQNELWLDALTATAQLKNSNPQDQNWTTILRDKFKLDPIITSKPIVDCCNSPNP